MNISHIGTDIVNLLKELKDSLKKKINRKFNRNEILRCKRI